MDSQPIAETGGGNGSLGQLQHRVRTAFLPTSVVGFGLYHLRLQMGVVTWLSVINIEIPGSSLAFFQTCLYRIFFFMEEHPNIQTSKIHVITFLWDVNFGSHVHVPILAIGLVLANQMQDILSIQYSLLKLGTLPTKLQFSKENMHS